MSDILYKAAYLIGDEMDWASWQYHGKFKVRDITGLGRVELVDVKEDSREPLWGDEYAQGSEGEIALTFKVTTKDDTHYFQKLGIADSYGSKSWGGKFIAVTPVEKTVYEYVKA